MAIYQFWNWEDDDSTKHMNWRTLGRNAAGRYAGFDADLSNGSYIELNHATTGADITMFDDPTFTVEQRGVLITKQGVIVQSNEVHQLPNFTPNTSIYPRIDLVICEHEYVDVQGASQPIFDVVVGTPAANPALPSIQPQAQIKIILGQVYVPAGATALTDAGVVYTQSPIPNFANDPNIMYLNKIQTSTAHKSFQSQSGVAFEQLTYSNVDNSITATVKSNFYILPYQGNGVDFITIDNIRGVFATMPESQPIYIYFSHKAFITVNTDGNDDGFILLNDVEPESKLIEAGEGIIIVKTFSQQWAVYSGGAADRNAINKFYQGQLFAKAPQATIVGTDLNTGPRSGNYIDVNVGLAQVINRIPSAIHPTGTANTEAGAFIYLSINNNSTILKHNGAAASGIYKPIINSTGADLSVIPGDIVILIEDTYAWRVVCVFEKFKQWLANSFEPAVLALIENREHIYNKLQSWAYDTLSRSSNYYAPTNTLRITPDGNVYRFDVANTDQPIIIKQIKVYRGALIGETDAPDGTEITIIVNPNISNPVQFVSDINGAADINGHPTSTTGFVPFVGDADGSGEIKLSVPQLENKKFVYVFVRSNSKWVLQSAQQHNMFVAILQDLRIQSLEGVVGGTWTLVNDPNFAATFSAYNNNTPVSLSFIVSQSFYKYKKLTHKTAVITFFASAQTAGAVDELRIALPNGYVGKDFCSNSIFAYNGSDSTDIGGVLARSHNAAQYIRIVKGSNDDIVSGSKVLTIEGQLTFEIQ